MTQSMIETHIPNSGTYTASLFKPTNTVMKSAESSVEKGQNICKVFTCKPKHWEGQDHVNLPSPLRRPTASEIVVLLDEFDTN